ncbi:MAG: glyoxylate/hydroxypyruvate reductase A, partial [Pseudomonadota bacterium]|nr:glyoxylate/hydroxypyruvate reductase A [Pseudomonadota bacterium]
MKVLLCGDFDAPERKSWLDALTRAMPEAFWLDTEAARQAPDDVLAAVVANPAPGSLQGLPRLRLIQSLWAGVDRLLGDITLPEGVPIARMVDPSLNRAMAETSLWAVLSLHRGFFDYAEQQRQQRWLQQPQRRADEVNVLVLGQGQMGQAAAESLAAAGYHVRGWRRDDLPLPRLLANCQVVVNLLPLTPATQGLLNAEFFADLPRGASVVNLGRGAHVVDADLLAALDSGHLERAVLDVFHTEPLPPAHPFWRHPRITVLPHAAA